MGGHKTLPTLRYCSSFGTAVIENLLQARPQYWSCDVFNASSIILRPSGRFHWRNRGFAVDVMGSRCWSGYMRNFLPRFDRLESSYEFTIQFGPDNVAIQVHWFIWQFLLPHGTIRALLQNAAFATRYMSAAHLENPSFYCVSQVHRVSFRSIPWFCWL